MRVNPHAKAVLAALAVALAATAIPALSLAGERGKVLAVVEAKLKGQAEVPGPGDPNGKGNVEVKLKKQRDGKKKACFDLSYRLLSGATAAHIHKGTDDVAGPVKLRLFGADPALPGEDRVRECVRTSGKLIRKIKRNPENFYVNVHNEEYPDGAIRGQLGPVGP